MNAPAPAAAIAPTVEVLPLAAIVPSSTHIQELRRARFTKDALEELANSIRRVGVLQPIVVRPAGLADKYELVAGERRWQAAKLAGLTEIRASVCVLSPEQVLEIQLIENLQREGLHELEEAEGYEELLKLKKINADALADMVKKSRSYVYGRLKLLALCPEARKAFYAGELDSSKALLVARIGHHDTQRQALKAHKDESHWGPMSFRDFQELTRERFMLELKSAPFDVKDPTLVPKAGTCEACPKRTGNQRELFSDVKGADICTDPKCFDDKRQATYQIEVKRLEAKGKKVISGDPAKKIFPYWESNYAHDRGRVDGGYHKLTESEYVGSSRATIASLLPKDYEPILVQHPQTGELVKVAPASVVSAALTRARKDGAPAKKASTAKPVDPALDTSDHAIEREVHKRVMPRIAKAVQGLGRQELIAIICEHVHAWEVGDEDDQVGPLFKLPSPFNLAPRALQKLSTKDLERYLVLGEIQNQLIDGFGNTDLADSYVRTLKIDRKALAKEILEERKKKAEEKAAGKLGTKWPFPTGSKPPIGKAKAMVKKPAAKVKGKKK